MQDNFVITLHSILVKSIRFCRLQSILITRTLHSILVKSIPVIDRVLKFHLLALHSILVKSIQPPALRPLSPYPALHSILVKSIHESAYSTSRLASLYIPFWLNLYGADSKCNDRADCLYIPFWLNLYPLWSAYSSASSSLHSILVKSILRGSTTLASSPIIFTFHSG